MQNAERNRIVAGALGRYIFARGFASFSNEELDELDACMDFILENLTTAEKLQFLNNLKALEEGFANDE